LNGGETEPKLPAEPSSEQKVSARELEKKGQTRLFVEQQIVKSAFLPPEIVGAFEKVLPGAADRVFRFAENEQRHAHKMDELDRMLPFRQVRTGQFIGFFLALCLMGGGVFLLYNGKDVSGFSSLATGLISLLAPHIFAAKNQKPETRESSK